MTEPFALKRVRQCAKCPWKVSTNPDEIPGGYSRQLHRDLKSTIAPPGLPRLGGDLRIFACHESPVGEEAHCIGWLMNQMGPGNNIALRLAMRNCTNLGQVKLDGPQHTTFEDTLPDEEEETDLDRHKAGICGVFGCDYCEKEDGEKDPKEAETT